MHNELSARLTLTDKLCVLRDLAWRLSDNNRSEIAVDQAARHVTAKLAGMRHLQGLEGPDVLNHLLHRSGVLRSSAEGSLDFLHRTFQEYLAASEAAVEDRIGNLVERAHLDLWRETVIMAAGHANRTQQGALLHGILERAAQEPRHTRALWLVAASCQETMPSVPHALGMRLDSTLARLIPPQRPSEAEYLAAVGTPLLRRLPPSLDRLTDAAAEATVLTSVRIGGEGALANLARYARDPRRNVRRLLARAWEYFDAEEYGGRVLRQLPLDELALHLTHVGQRVAVARLPEVRWLVVDLSAAQDLTGLDQLPPLRGLFLDGLRGETDLSPVTARPELEALGLAGQGHLRNVRFDGLGALAMLALRSWSSLPPLDELALPGSLAELELNKISEGYDLTALDRLPHLSRLVLVGSGRPRGIDEMVRSGRLTALELCGFDLGDWPPLRGAFPRCLRFASECVLPFGLELPPTCTIRSCRTPDGRTHRRNS
ncbi:NACHT domain-containing protein [Streptomyces kanamyceticus]|uniref:NACHT domain-containing protein n=1 Tax=Streptomyces kanamyceticus TaxID=1967 RepID=UPI0007C74ADC|nr:hypothetical protein [Streptomyces kanamyceticus]